MKDYPLIETLYVNDDSSFREITLLPNGETVNEFKHNMILDYYPLEKNDLCIVIVGWDRDFHMIANLIKEIEYKTINKIYFFIQDIFRLRDKNLNRTLRLKLDSINHAFELDVIEILLDNLKYKSYEIYHCELDEKNIFGKNLRYFDSFLTRLAYLGNLKKSLKHKGEFEQRFCCFNGRFQAERYLISCFLSNHDSFITNLYWSPNKELESNPQFYLNKINEKYRNKILDGNKLLPKKIKRLDVKSPKINTNKSITTALLLSVHKHSNNTMEVTKKTFCEIITETNFSRHLPNISEKTIKTIMCMRPFILVAPPNTLKLLRNLGFKTFSSVWDESYDQIENDQARLEKIFSLIDEIGSWSNEKILEVNISLKRILKYNREHFATKKYLEIMRNFNQ